MTTGQTSLATATMLTAILYAAGAVAGPPKDPSCDPNWQTLDQAMALQAGHNPDAAIAMAQGILDKQPKDFRAKYIIGLALIDKGQRDAGMKQLSHAADLLPQYSTCARTNGWYAVYNALGAEYYNQGNIGMAESSLNVAFSQLSTLDRPTQQKVLSNMGTLYLRKGDLGKAQTFYQNANAIHAPGAAARLSSVKNLASPAH